MLRILERVRCQRARRFVVRLTQNVVLRGCVLLVCGASQALAQYRFDVLNTDTGLPENSVQSILQTRDGYLWFTTLDGLVRYDGVRQPSAIEMRDGRIWFPTFNGIAVVDPKAVTFNAVPPPVVIEQVILDREEMNMQLPIEITPGNDTLAIQYTALSFIKPEQIQFKYRLEGLDAEAQLIAAINTANGNNADDVIDLGGQTFTLTAANNTTLEPSGLPAIQGDNGHRLVIENGRVERNTMNGTPLFRLFFGHDVPQRHHDGQLHSQGRGQ